MVERIHCQLHSSPCHSSPHSMEGGPRVLGGRPCLRVSAPPSRRVPTSAPPIYSHIRVPQGPTRVHAQCHSATSNAPRELSNVSFPGLSSTGWVYVRKDGYRWPLTQPYSGPFRIAEKRDNYFILNVNGRHDAVSIDRLKLAHGQAPQTRAPTRAGSEALPSSLSPGRNLPVPTTTLLPTSHSGRILRRPVHCSA